MSPAPGRRLVPAYLVTGGQEQPTGAEDFDRLTVLRRATGDPPADGTGPQHRRLWDLLEPGALTVVECSAHLGLPVSATVFLAATLVGQGSLHARNPVPDTGEIDRTLVERLLVGLRALP